MNSTEIVTLFRETVEDQELPYLWSDTLAYQYLDDAQKMFCRKTGGLGDGSSALTQLTYTDATDWVDISPLILKFRGAMDRATGQPITIMNFEDLRSRGMRFDGKTGDVRIMVIGIEPGRARLYPVPRAAGDIDLIVDRLPLKKITDAGDQKLEVAEQHHQHLVLWMAHRAYSRQDTETANPKRAADFGGQFLAYCEDAKNEKERALHKTREVSYGGI